MQLSWQNLKNGQIGLIEYYVEVEMPMSSEQEQRIVDKDVGSALNALLRKTTLNPGVAADINIQDYYMKARMNARDRADQMRKVQKKEAVYHQVGQAESIQELIELEKKPNFRGWVNIELAMTLKEWTPSPSNK